MRRMNLNLPPKPEPPAMPPRKQHGVATINVGGNSDAVLALADEVRELRAELKKLRDVITEAAGMWTAKG